MTTNYFIELEQSLYFDLLKQLKQLEQNFILLINEKNHPLSIKIVFTILEKNFILF